ncbi:hypothetical protein [Mastigocladopsis repens]|uniref:hypothetical protein n=1 Tax=Mastigocladopsis repens TaxID=221287 RepID=UPI0002F7BC72|nr:hypothetical protein [Mastigocladopsis repens]
MRNLFFAQPREEVEQIKHTGSTLSTSTVVWQLIKEYQQVEAALQVQHPRRQYV